MADEASPDWKLRLRYGRLETPFQHFTVLADVRVVDADAELGSVVGSAWLAMKVWAPDADGAGELVGGIATQLGAEVHGRIEVYSSEAAEPPRDAPFAYEPSFTAYTA